MWRAGDYPEQDAKTMTRDAQARQTAQNLANSNSRPVFIHTTPAGEYVITLQQKDESEDGDLLTLVEVVEPKIGY